jgi:hypothetical protein
MRCAGVAGDAQVVVDAKEGNKVVVGWESSTIGGCGYVQIGGTTVAWK